MTIKNLIITIICIIFIIALAISNTGCTSAPPTPVVTPTPTIAPIYTALPTISKIAAGGSHGLAINDTGTAVYAWGHNDYGQLGLGDTTIRYAAKQINGLSNISAIAGGLQHSLAVTNTGSVYAWGRNNGAQLGDNSNADRHTPVLINFTGTPVITSVAAGNQHSLALDNSGNVWAWGANNCGQLGTGDKTERKTPVKIGSLSGIIAIAANGDHSLALKNDGTVWAWGRNDYGQLGNTLKSESNTPIQVEETGFTNVSKIAAGWHHNIALKNDGSLWTWGWNYYGQLGNGNYGNINEKQSPTQVTTGIINIDAGWHHCIVSLAGAVKVWGVNTDGYLGVSPTPNCGTPTSVTDLNGSTINAVAGGGGFCIVLKSDGTVWAWGSSVTGNPTNTSSKVPVQVMLQTN